MLFAHQLKDSLWLHLVEPTRAEVEQTITDNGINPGFLKAVLDNDERSHVETVDDQALVVVNVPIKVKESNHSYETFPIGIIIKKDILVTVTLKDTPIFHNHCKDRNRTSFVFSLLLGVAELFLQSLKTIDASTDAMEKRANHSLTNEEVIKLRHLEKSLVYFSAASRANEAVLEKLAKGYAEQYPIASILSATKEDLELLNDAELENKQAIEMCTIYREILDGLLATIASLVGNNLNTVMKFLTSITLIISVPTLIASIYGMNVTLPFQNRPNAFTLLMVANTLLTGLVTYWLARRRLL